MNQQSKPPGLVNWAGYIALTLLLALPLSVLAVRSGAWQLGLLLYAIACLGSIVVLLLSIVLLLLPRFAPWRKAIAGRALLAIPGTALLLSLASGGGSVRIHDITTDTQIHPPSRWQRSSAAPTANSLEIDQTVIAQQQRPTPTCRRLSAPCPSTRPTAWPCRLRPIWAGKSIIRIATPA